MARTKPWEVNDDVWERVRPLIPPAPSHAKGERRRMDDRKAFEAIVYVLRTGIQWNALPREVGASSTVHNRFQEWERAGLFKAVWQAGLSEYDDLKGIQWEWQAVDGVMTKAPFAGAATGANPTDRGKRGTKRSLLTDGAGIPLALVVDGANRHDVKLLSATLDGLVISRPEPTPEQPQYVCLDAAYESTPVYTELLVRHYQHTSAVGGRETRKRVHPWLSCATMGGGTHSFLAQSLTQTFASVGEEERELSRLPSPGLCSTDLCQGTSFRISTKSSLDVYSGPFCSVLFSRILWYPSAIHRPSIRHHL